MMIPFADWAPDLPAYGNRGAENIANCIPQPGGYAPFQALAASTNALTAYPRGAISVQDTDQNAESFAGDETKLYRLTGNSWADVTNTGGNYALGPEDYWEFAQFGTQVLAVAFTESPQTFTLGSSSNFADLGGSPPKARTIAVVRDFVVLGNNTGAPNRVRWSAINDATSWTVGSSQADQQDIPDGGWVQRIIGGEVGYVFQERAITRMTYVGPPTIFQFDLVQSNRGVSSPAGVIKIGEMIYFLATDGFYVLDAISGSVRPIGHGKVDQFFLDDLNTGYLSRVSAAFDVDRRVVFWSYPSDSSVDGTPDKLVCYHYPTDRWSIVSQSAEFIFPHLTEGISLDSLDDISTNMDGSSLVSLDSRAYKGGNRVLAGFTTGNAMGFFQGSSLDATLETGEFEAIPGRRSHINRLRPLVDAATITGIVRSKEKLADALSDSASSAMNTSGYIPVRSSGRYHAVRLTVGSAQSWNFAQGVELDAVAQGMR